MTTQPSETQLSETRLSETQLCETNYDDGIPSPLNLPRHAVQDVQEPGPVELYTLKSLMDDYTQKMRETWEREKNPHIAMGPYFYAATLTVSSALPFHQQKQKLLKMMATLLRGKSIGLKYQVIPEESYHVWELTQAKTLHIHLLVKSKLPAKEYDIRKVTGMQGANWQELKSYAAWIKYLNKNLIDPEHIETKAKLALTDNLPNGEKNDA